MKKFILALLSAVMVSLAAMAYEYPYLTLTAPDGSFQVVAVESLSMTIEDGSLVLHNATGTLDVPLSQLSSMHFAMDVSAIEVPRTVGGNSPYDVYSLMGLYVGTFTSAQQAAGELPRGIYVMKNESSTRKIVVR